VVELFRSACRARRIEDGITLVQAASLLRPSFTAPDDVERPPAPVRLARADRERPALACFASLVMVSGPQEYARFAAALRGRRDVVVLPEPGFAPGEPLPASIDAVVDLQVDAVTRTWGDAPFVIVGRSSGGWVAHAVAERLERRGARPRALVLLDSPMPGDATTYPIIQTAVLEREERLGLMDATRVTAMGAYLRVFDGWRPRRLRTPTVLVRPTGPVRDRSGAPVGGGRWRFAWDAPHSELNVPGDHLTMMEEHAADTALALDAWLTERGR
jgi:thioesterase domain-containing protein